MSSHSNDWLHALHFASSGLRQENEDIRIAVGLRLGAAIYQAHQCPCGAVTEVNGLHGLSCKLGSGENSKHASLNYIIYHASYRADIPAVKESTGSTRTDGKRPYGSTLVPWSAGKFVLLGFIIADSMAPFYATISSVWAGLVAEQSSARMVTKYSELAISHIFVPIAMESVGPTCAEAHTFLSEL